MKTKQHKPVNLHPTKFMIIMIITVLTFTFIIGSYLYNVQASNELDTTTPTFDNFDDEGLSDLDNNNTESEQEETLELKSFNNGFSAYNYAENYLASLDRFVIKGSGYMKAELSVFTLEENLEVLSYKISKSECANHLAVLGKFNYDLQDFFANNKVYKRVNRANEYEQVEEDSYKININRRKMVQVFEVSKNTAICSGFKNGAKEYSCSFTLLNPASLGSQVDSIVSSFLKLDRATNFKSCTINIVLNKYGQPKSYTYLMSGVVYTLGLSADINLKFTEHFGYFNKNVEVDLNKFSYIPYTKEA